MTRTQELLQMCRQCIESHLKQLAPSKKMSLWSLIEQYARLRVDAFAEENRED